MVNEFQIFTLLFVLGFFILFVLPSVIPYLMKRAPPTPSKNPDGTTSGNERLVNTRTEEDRNTVHGLFSG